MKYRKLITWISIILIIGTAGVAAKVFMSMKPEPVLTNYEKSKRLVQTKFVSYNEISSLLEVQGRLTASQIVEVISEVQGKIIMGDVSLKKGQTFQKGEMLCKIYDVEQILSLKASKSRFLNTLANALPDIKFDFPDKYEDVLSFFDRVQIDMPIPELPDIKDKKIKIFLASRDILNQYYNIKMSEERLRKYYLTAPFDGTFIDVYLEVGGIANPGTRIAKIIETDNLELEVPVEVDDLKWIKIGGHVNILSESRTESWKGNVVRISEFVDPATQSAGVFVEVKNNGKYPVYAGMYLIALFEGQSIEQSMEIPRQAVFNQNEVFVVEDGTLRKERINILKINETSLVFDGLPEGTELVVEPLINVREGTVVDIKRP